MKKNTSIIFLSIFALAMSVFGFIGIQPVKASTTLGEGEGAITVEDTDIQFKGASLDWAEEKFDEEKGIITSDEGRLKFYSSYSTKLISELESKGKTYKLGTLVARAEDFASYEDVTVEAIEAKGVIPVETTEYKKTYNSGAEGEVDAWWTMVSVDNIPRAYYGVPLVARPYIAVDVDGNGEYENIETDNEYAYAPYVKKDSNDENEKIENFAYSLASTAQMKLDAGHFNVQDGEGLTKTGEKVRDTYTKFKVTVYYDPLRLEEGEEGWDELQIKRVWYVEEGKEPYYKDHYYREITYNFRDPITNSQLYEATPFAGKGDTYYNFSKGFYDKTRTYWIDALDITLNANHYQSDANIKKYSPYLTLVYGDMSLYEVLGPANLIDDFATEYSKRAAVKKVGTKASGTYNLYQFDYMQQDDAAVHYGSYKDDNGVVEDGVLEVNSYFKTDRTSESNRYFMFKSSLRGGRYFYNASGVSDYDPTSYDEETGKYLYYENGKESDYDYVSFRILIKTSKAKELIKSVTLGAGAVGPVDNTNEETLARPRIGAFYDSFNGTDFASEITVPTNQWITVRLTRMYYEKAIGNDRMSAINVKGNVSMDSFLYVNDGCRVDNKNNPAKEGEYKLLLDEISFDRDMRVAINDDDGVDMVELKNINTGSKDKPELVDRTFITRTRQLTANAGEAITLSTVLKNGTIKYSVVAPNGEITDLDGNTFTPTQIGTYKVIATCDDYLLQGGNRPGISKSYQYGEVTFESLGRDVNFNLTGADDLTAVQKGSTLNITNVTVDGLELDTAKVIYEVKCGEEDVEVEDGEFVASKLGDYTVTVKYVYNGVEFVDTQTITVVPKQIELGAKFYLVEGEGEGETRTEITEGQTIWMDSKIAIKLFANSVETTNGITYVVKRVDVDNSANNYEFTVTDATFIAGFVGDYEIVVTYTEDGESYTFETALEVVANTYENARYVETFSDSESVTAVYKTTDTSSETYKNKYDVYAENTTWEREHEGRYGVIKTQPQNEYNNNGKWSNTNLAIFLRSSEYRSTAQMEAAGLAKTVYNNDTLPAKENAAYAAINSDKWDYISVWVYFPKVGATDEERITVSIIYNTQEFEVKYNEWTEIKIDKPRMMFSFSSASEGDIFKPLHGDSKARAVPLFFISSTDAQGNSNLTQQIYIDSISFQQYEGYERFSELYLYDTVNEKAITKDVVNTVEYVGETATAEFNIVAKIPSESDIVDVDYSKMMTKVGVGNISKPYDYFTMTTKNDEPVKLQNSIYDDEGDDGIYNIKIATVKASNYIALCLTYYDEATDKNYLGWIHIKIVVA